MCVSELAEAFDRINLQSEQNAASQSIQEQLHQAFMYNEVHIHSLRSEIAEATAAKISD